MSTVTRERAMPRPGNASTLFQLQPRLRIIVILIIFPPSFDNIHSTLQLYSPCPTLLLFLYLWDASERLLFPDQGFWQFCHVLPVASASPVTQESFQDRRLFKGCAFCASSSWTDRMWQRVSTLRFQLLPGVEQGVQQDVAMLKIQRHRRLYSFAFLKSL